MGCSSGGKARNIMKLLVICKQPKNTSNSFNYFRFLFLLCVWWPLQQMLKQRQLMDMSKNLTTDSAMNIVMITTFKMGILDITMERDMALVKDLQRLLPMLNL